MSTVAEVATSGTASDAQKITAATRAIGHILRRLQTDPRVAYHFDPLTESFEGLTHAYALLTGQDVEAVRATTSGGMRFEAPTAPAASGTGGDAINARLLAVARQVVGFGVYRDRVESMSLCLRPYERQAFETLLRCEAPAAVAQAEAALPD